MSLSSGTSVGPYEIVALLGAGGMGEVYRARDTKLDRDLTVGMPQKLFDQQMATQITLARAASTTMWRRTGAL
jgi:serine/threonine protein kinase